MSQSDFMACFGAAAALATVTVAWWELIVVPDCGAPRIPWRRVLRLFVRPKPKGWPEPEVRR